MAFFTWLHTLLWSPALLVGMLVVSIFFMHRIRWLPLRLTVWKKTIGQMFVKRQKKGTLSQFQIVMTNLGAVMGIGNMVGVATALIAGGPGALFWMWLSAVLVGSLKFGEIVLAMQFRKRAVNGYVGGPMYYMEDGLKSKWMGKLYALLMVLTSFGIGNMVSSGAIAQTLSSSLQVPVKYIAMAVVIAMGFVINGGLKRVVRFSEILVPYMVCMYLVAAIIIIVMHIDLLPEVMMNVLWHAFDWQAVLGGGMGVSIKYGIARGIFSNEAGMGSGTLTHVQSENTSCVEQGLWGIVEIAIDTLFMCTLSGVLILITNTPLSITEPTLLLKTAFSTAFPAFGSEFVTLSITLFGFASMIGWYYYGKICLRYLSERKSMSMLYGLLFLCFLYIGAHVTSQSAWMFSDIMNGLLLWLNLTAMCLLCPIIFKEVKKYLTKD